MNSLSALAWIFPFLLGCALLVFDGHIYAHMKPRKAMLGWLAMIGLAGFITAPGFGNMPLLMTLAAMPILAACLRMRPAYLRTYYWCFGVVIGGFSIGLFYQFLHYTVMEPGFVFAHQFLGVARIRPSWPMLDPNNAAAVMNIGLFPSLYMALRDWRFWPAVLLFLTGIVVTASMAGCMLAAVGCIVVLALRWPCWWLTFPCIAPAVPLVWPTLMECLSRRMPIWSTGWEMMQLRPFSGIGIGIFKLVYDHLRVEHGTSGYFVHNDVMQIAIEMGWPAALVFGVMWLEAVWKLRAVALCVLLAVLMHSMVEFQFYVPAISILLGVALACERKPAYAY